MDDMADLNDEIGDINEALCQKSLRTPHLRPFPPLMPCLMASMRPPLKLSQHLHTVFPLSIEVQCFGRRDEDGSLGGDQLCKAQLFAGGQNASIT